MQLAEQEDLYGPNPMELRSVAARRMLASPGVHASARSGRSDETPAQRRERKRERNIARERERERAREEMRQVRARAADTAVT